MDALREPVCVHLCTPLALKFLHALKAHKWHTDSQKHFLQREALLWQSQEEEYELKPWTGPLLKSLQGRPIFYVQGANVLLKPLWISLVSLVLSAALTEPQKCQSAAQGYFGVDIIRFGVLALRTSLRTFKIHSENTREYLPMKLNNNEKQRGTHFGFRLCLFILTIFSFCWLFVQCRIIF